MTLDVGTSSVRAMLYDLQANQVRGLEVQKALYGALTIDRILDTDHR
jgi:ribulose kinase